MARKVETLTVFLSHNIRLQLSNSEGGGGNSYVRTHSSQMPFFFLREIYCWGKADSVFFFPWVIMDSIALKSVDLWVGNTKQTNRNRVMQQPDVS